MNGGQKAAVLNTHIDSIDSVDSTDSMNSYIVEIFIVVSSSVFGF